jgi:hypothetical protein
MRVMVLVKADKNSEAGVLPDEKLLSDMGKFNEELAKAGIMLAGERFIESPWERSSLGRGTDRWKRLPARERSDVMRQMAQARWDRGGRGEDKPVVKNTLTT